MGAPPGFSAGDSWSVPLVDPMANGRLIVPVTIHDHGPYLFLLDRDAGTVIGPDIVHDLDVPVKGWRVLDYFDRSHPAMRAQLTDVHIGDLTISLVHAAVLFKSDLFDEDGRRIHGVLGYPYIADSLVFGFDRDRGIAWLQAEDTFHPPAEASELGISKVSSEGTKIVDQPILRDAKIGALSVDVHADFFSAHSELVRSKWNQAGVELQPAALTLVDDAELADLTRRAGVAREVEVGGVKSERVAFAPYEDRRYPLYHLDGTLGLDYFRPFKVAADWHHSTIYVTSREDALASRAARLSRWGAQLPRCASPGCAQVTLTGSTLHVVPDSAIDHPIEVVVRGTAKSGTSLPNVYLELAPGTQPFETELELAYVDGRVDVVDASPFPRPCPGANTCVMIQSFAP
jgi:hypothetical protein